ncbi:MAG: DNA repair protein RecN [Desulfobulbaceae bacterium A2]|nr:MAG: DNA repair protein RecN [Desulfobulbaceae bacterium A2]
MLRALRIENLALIGKLELEFGGAGLVVLSGETGAGKSIVMRGLHLLAGGRSQTGWIRGGCDEAVVEGLFELDPGNEEAVALLAEQGLAGPECIVRRHLGSDGRGRFYVNDRLVTARLVAALTSDLVHIVGQHDQQQLLAPRRHLDLLDSIGELWSRRRDFGRGFAAWREVEERLAELRGQGREREQRADFLGYQVREIREIAPQAGEDEDLTRERDRLKSADTLIALAQRGLESLDGEIGVLLSRVRRDLDQAAQLDGTLNELARRLDSVGFEVEDITAELRGYHQGLAVDPAALEQVGARLAQLQQLKRKYGENLVEVLDFARQAEEELAGLENLDSQIAAMEREATGQREQVLAAARDLSEQRVRAARQLVGAMERELSSLSFTGARFTVEFEGPEARTTEQLGATGWDHPAFYFSANPGEALKPLAQVASGGELSRLMLALKCLLARRDQVGTVVFDEVDAGIGGQAAEAVAAKIHELAAHHQIFCITHLPQIAAWADEHLQVLKEVEDGRTSTSVRRLDRDGCLAELARMLAGEAANDETRRYARDLLARCGSGAA